MKAQIVLVEDNPGDVILVKEALYSRGLRVDLCVIDTEGQADEFFSTLGDNEHACPVLVLLDLNLPELEPEKFLRQLRTHPSCAHVDVVVLSSTNNLAERQFARALGTDKFFLKAADLEEFLKLGDVVAAHLASYDSDHRQWSPDPPRG